MGSLHEKSLVKVSQREALGIFVCNCVLPGFGTMIAGFINGGDALVNNLIVGSLQLYFACIVVGWIWSVYTAYLIY